MMSIEIIPLTKAYLKAFEPCILPNILPQMQSEAVFGYGISEEGQAVGAIVCSYEDDIVNILSLGISPYFRGCGYARLLLNHLKQQCSAKGFFEIHARYFMEAQARAPLEALLTSCGYSIQEGSFKQVRFALGALKGSLVEKRLEKMQAAHSIQKMVRYAQLDSNQQQWLLNQVSILWEERTNISSTRSCVTIQNGQIVGAVLLSEKEGLLEILQLYSSPNNKTASMLCLFATMGEAYATLPTDTMVHFHAVDDIAASLIDNLLADCVTETIRERIAYRSVSMALADTDALLDESSTSASAPLTVESL